MRYQCPEVHRVRMRPKRILFCRQGLCHGDRELAERAEVLRIFPCGTGGNRCTMHRLQRKHTTTSATDARDVIGILTSWKMWIAGVFRPAPTGVRELDGSGSFAVSKIRSAQCGELCGDRRPGCPAERSSDGFR